MWRFTPAMVSGQPVEVWLTIPFRFQQDEGKRSPAPEEVAPAAPQSAEEAAASFEARLQAALERTTRTAEECAALTPVVFDLLGRGARAAGRHRRAQAV